MKISGFCYDMHFHYSHFHLKKTSQSLPVRIEIIVTKIVVILTWVTSFSLYIITRYHSDKVFTKIMLPVLNLGTNYVFHELCLKCIKINKLQGGQHMHTSQQVSMKRLTSKVFFRAPGGSMS